MNRKQVNNRGVTLVELVVALAILAMVMTAVIMMMSSNSVVYRKTKSDIDVQTKAQETFNTLQDSIMQAKYIEMKGYTDTDPTIVTYKKKSLAADGETVTDFSKLKDDSGEVTTYTTVYPTQIKVKYSIEADDTMENKNCDVTYYFVRYEDKGESKCDMYVTRDFEEAGVDDDMPLTTQAATWAKVIAGTATKDERDQFQEFLFTNSMTEAKVTVDSTTQTFNFVMDFLERGMRYNNSSIVSCRNSYVTKDPRDRTKLDIEITETEGAGGGEGSSETGGGSSTESTESGH